MPKRELEDYYKISQRGIHRLKWREIPSDMSPILQPKDQLADSPQGGQSFDRRVKEGKGSFSSRTKPSFMLDVQKLSKYPAIPVEASEGGIEEQPIPKAGQRAGGAGIP